MPDPSFLVGSRDAGRRVERFLAGRLQVSLDHVHKLLRQGRVEVGRGTERRPVEKGHVLQDAEWLYVVPKEGPRPAPLPNRKIRIHTLHEDDDLLAVAKPAGLAMHPGPGHGSDTLLNVLVGRWSELLELGPELEYGLVHRLDLATSGVVLVARSAAAYHALVAAFAAREVKKEYWALVRGRPRDNAGAVYSKIDDKEAETAFQVEAEAGPVTQMTLRPKTGRTHQIRIHAKRLGCPVLGDPRYGDGLDELTARLRLRRLALHATRLELTHPISGAPLELSHRLPRDLRQVWKQAQKLSAE